MKLPNLLNQTTQFSVFLIVSLTLLIAGCLGGGGGGIGLSTHLNWTNKASMPTARTMMSSGMVNGRIYVIGGYIGTYIASTIVGTVEEYDPALNTWATKTSMPTARKGLTSAVVNGKIYAIGGAGSCAGSCSTVEEYDPATDTWATKAQMPTPRNYITSSVVNGKIYVIGGYMMNTVEEYDPIANTWATKASMPTAREGLTSAVVNGKIYTLGGGQRDINNNIIELATVEEYDPASDTWLTKTSMPTARDGLTSQVVNSKIYVIGGFNSTPLATVEVYDPVANTWSNLSSQSSMPTPRNQLTSEEVNGTIYAIGGCCSMSTVEAFTP